MLLSFRGHGGSDALDGGWDYDVLADDVRTVADHVGATRCVGLSLGGGALLRVLRDDPDRFERLAFVLPAALDSTRGDGATERLRSLGHAIDRGDADEATALLMAEVPEALRERRGVELLLRRRAADLVHPSRPRPARRGPAAVRPLGAVAHRRADARRRPGGRPAAPDRPRARSSPSCCRTPRCSSCPRAASSGPTPSRVQTALADHLEDIVTLLEGKTLLVTGVLTDKSIAFSVARLAAEQGATVVLTGFGRTAASPTRIAKRLPGEPPVIELDVTTEADLDGAARAASASTPTGSTACCTPSASRRRRASARACSTRRGRTSRPRCRSRPGATRRSPAPACR